MMHGHEKSDLAIVALKPANKAEQSAAESVERRAGTKGMRTSKARAGRRAVRVTGAGAHPLIALAASRLALRAPRRGGGFGHDPAPVTAHNAPFPSYKNRLAKRNQMEERRCETNWSFLRSCLGC